MLLYGSNTAHLHYLLVLYRTDYHFLAGSLRGRKLNYIMPILVVCWIIAPNALSVVPISMAPFITVDDSLMDFM
jgi:hypothetical protein